MGTKKKFETKVEIGDTVVSITVEAEDEKEAVAALIGAANHINVMGFEKKKKEKTEPKKKDKEEKSSSKL